MKFNKGIIVICLLILLLGIASVNASDVNDTVVASDEQNDDVIGIENQDNVGATEENTLSASDGTFTDLANEIANSTGELKLAKNYVYDSSKDSNYKNGIVINKEITINGRGFIINGNNQVRAFNVSHDNVILRNIEFTNCNISGSGGAVYWNGNNGSLYDCNFINCNSSYLGGAVYWNGDNGSLYDCSFINCSSSKFNSRSYGPSGSSSCSVSGGAVYWNGDNGNLYDCSFIDCKNFVSNSQFSSSSSTTPGVPATSSATSTSSSFGGAVYWNGNNGNLFNCDFINCYSYSHSKSDSYSSFVDPKHTISSYSCSSGSASYSYSYGVYWNGNNGSLYDCSFINSSSSSSSDSLSDSQSDTLTRASTSSTSSSRGGAVYWNGTNGNLFDCNFMTPTSNSVSGSSSTSKFGGAVYWYGDDGNLLNSSFINCHVPYRCHANAIYWYGNNGNLFNCNFINSSTRIGHTSGYNGSVYWKGDNGYLFNCSFNGNYYNYEIYCGRDAQSTVHPVILIHISSFDNENDHIVFFESTPLVNNISVKIYNVTDRKILYDEFDISSEDLIASLNLNNLGDGEYQIVLEYEGDKFYTATSTNELFKIGENSSFEVIITENLVDGDNATINVTLNEDATGKVKLTLYNYTFINDLIDGKTTFQIPYLNGGINTYKIKYGGDDKYNPIYLEDTFIVLFNSNICLDLNEHVFEDNILLNYNIAPNCTGNISIFVDNVFKGDIPVGEVIELKNIEAGEHNITVIYNGDEYYSTSEDSAIITLIIKPSPFISADPVTVKYGQDAAITVNLYSDVPGNVRFTINGVTKKSKITNGVANYTVSGLNYGLYNVDISYAGNYKYGAYSINTTLKVNKNYPIVSIIADDIEYHENAIITANLAPNVPGNIKFTVNGITQKAKITDGVATTTFSGLKGGTYEVTATYAGNVNYVAQTKTTTLTVTKGTPIISVDMPDVGYGEDAVINVDLFSDVPGNVHITVNGVTKKAKITNGKATYAFSGLKKGSYDVTIYYAGNVNYNSQTIIAGLNVVKGTPITAVTVDDINMGETAVVNVQLANNVNGFVKITVNGVTQRVQIVDGFATSNFSGLKAGTYDVTVVYAGNANWEAQTVMASLTVNKISPGLTISKAIVNNKIVITSTIAKDAPGNIRIIANGVTYKVAISNGIASVTLPDLEPGSYVVEAVYAGNYKYLAETKSLTVRI